MNLVEQIDQVYKNQLNHKFRIKNSSAKYRVDKLKKTKDRILKYQSEIEEALSSDFGKSPHETVLTEIMPVVAMINLYTKNLAKWMRPERIGNSMLFFGTESKISYEAKGNVLVISPWNYPFQLAMYPVLTAFSAGNTVTIKPSEFTPATNKIINKILNEVFMAEEVSMIEGEVEATNLLMEKPYDHVFFTGSTPVGKIIMEKASKNLTSVSLELGGKSPAVVVDDFDIEVAAKRIAWGKHVNSGQTCVAPDYVLIEEKYQEQFIAAYKSYLNTNYGNNFNQNEDFCKIITPRHAQRLKSLVDDALAKGARCEYGGHLFENNKFEPTILSHVTLDMDIMQDEIFGPLLPIIAVDSQAEMIKTINQLDNPLAMYVFTESHEKAEYFRKNTNSGSLGINDTLIHVAHPSLPFGGAGKSGHGRYHGKHGFEEFSNQRSTINRRFDPGTSYFYPPYDAKKKQLIDKLIGKFNKLF